MARLYANGINQWTLVDLLVSIRASLNGILAKLDTDTGIADTDYAATYAVAIPAGIQTTQVKAIRDQGQVVTFLNDVITNFNGALEKLDADGGAIVGTNYEELLAIPDVVGNSAVDAVFDAGVYQGAKIAILDAILKGINALAAKLDADAGVNQTNYAATFGLVDTVVEEGGYKVMRKIALLIAVGLGLTVGAGAAELRTGVILDNPALAHSTAIDYDVGPYSRLSVQAVFEGVTPASHTVTDGSKSTATITVTSHTGLTGAYIRVGDVYLTQGVEWTAVDTTSGTARSISDAIVAHAILSTIITSTWSGSVVYATSTAFGVNDYHLATSTTALQITANRFQEGAAGDIAIAANTITKPGHAFTTGLQVLFQKTAGTDPTGLTSGTTYYAIRLSPNAYKLAATSTGSVAGLAVNISALTGKGSFTLTPLTFSAGSTSFKWQASNDKANWVDLSVSSVTNTSINTGGTAIWDLAAFAHRYLRLNFVGPSAGGVRLRVIQNGRIER